MPDPSHPELRLTATLRQWFAEQSARDGFGVAVKRLASLLWEFVRDSLPSRRRQRYGDMQYDWDYHVDTTSATVGWRARLLGLFHSPYQPTDPALFHKMLASVVVNFRQFTFIDIGSGKGRVLLIASDYPFRRILGVELLPELHRIAQENISRYKSDWQKCFTIESICADAREFVFPEEPTLLYLFSPLPESGFAQFLANLERSLRDHPRPLLLIYHNPLLEHLLVLKPILKKISGTHQYSIYTA
ncbi:MAG: class I SAM-dependent methyltransferase [Terriglobales bacterium]